MTSKYFLLEINKANLVVHNLQPNIRKRSAQNCVTMRQAE